MNESLKIKTQDGLVYFDKFEEAKLTYYKKDNGKIVINIYVSADSEDRSENDITSLQKRLNETLHPEAYECWIELRLFHTELLEIEELNNFTIRIEKGYDINLENDSAAHYGIWSPRELYKNEIVFREKESQFKLIWKAVSDDVNYYNHMAKECDMELECNLNIIGFNSENEYWEYEKKQLGI
ncbi:hypothetical protein [Winogradskyella sediminis]|uniref:hypothetical protein n=1 Tax=Winogradskyella sediminis TaxID=1382466 RepID=UPI000E225B44|nr:hypothetical protein [Winogradskyella sediminis]REG82339.1 hypothetical protein C8N41_1211 [Winogradskyella sediminis]